MFDRLDLLPFEVLVNILQFLRDVDLDSLGRASLFFSVLTKEREVWRQLYARYRVDLNQRLCPGSRERRENLIQKNIFKGIFTYQVRSGHYVQTPHVRLQLKVRELFLKNRLDSFLSRRPNLDHLAREKPGIFCPLGLSGEMARKSLSPALAPIMAKLSLEITGNRVSRSFRHRQHFNLYIQERLNSHLLEEQRRRHPLLNDDDDDDDDDDTSKSNNHHYDGIWPGTVSFSSASPSSSSLPRTSTSPRLFATQIQLAKKLNQIKLSRFLVKRPNPVHIREKRISPALTYERLVQDYFKEDGDLVHRVTDARPSLVSVLERNVLHLGPLQFAQMVCPAITPKIKYFESMSNNVAGRVVDQQDLNPTNSCNRNHHDEKDYSPDEKIIFQNTSIPRQAWK